MLSPANPPLAGIGIAPYSHTFGAKTHGHKQSFSKEFHSVADVAKLMKFF